MSTPQAAGAAVDRWWVRDPDRLAREVAGLRAAGYHVRVRREHGLLSLLLHRPDDDLPWRQLRIDYPPSYPWSDPHVFLSPRGLRQHGQILRHIRPDTGQLCLTSDSPEADHDPTELAASLLARQLPRLRSANTRDTPREALAGLEEQTPHTHQTWVVAHLDEVVLLDPTVDPDGPYGWAQLAPGGLQDRPLLLRGLVEEGREQPLATPRHSGPAQPDRIPWVRLERRLDPFTDRPRSLWREAHQLHPHGPTPRQGPRQHVLLRVHDETGYRREGWSWLYLTRSRNETTHRWRTPVFGRVQHIGRSVQTARTPRTRHLQDCAVLLVGAGALGSELASHLVRAGLGTIALIDPKPVDAAATARQYSTIGVGFHKVVLLALTLLAVKPDLHLLRIMRLDVLNVPPSSLAQLMQETDLVIDATANRAASRYLAVQARQHHRSWLSVAATAGAYGGWISHLPPDGPCHCCLEHARATGQLPLPPADPHGLVQPEHCLDHTFTGTAHDLAPLIAQAARTATDLLADPTRTAAQVLTYDSGLTDQQPPSWTRTDLRPHPACVLHTRAQEPAQEYR